MSRRTDRLSTYLGTCPTTGKRQHETRAKARKAGRIAGVGLHAYLCADCDLWHVGHMGRSTREDMRDRRREPSEKARALAELYKAMPTQANWNALMTALDIRHERSNPYRNGRDRDPTANTAIGKADRERKSS